MDNAVPSESLQNIYSLIREDEFEKLQLATSTGEIEGIGHLLFDNIEEDEEALSLYDDGRVTTASLNPILLAINFRSIACLKLLVA